MIKKLNLLGVVEDICLFFVISFKFNIKEYVSFAIVLQSTEKLLNAIFSLDSIAGTR